MTLARAGLGEGIWHSHLHPQICTCRAYAPHILACRSLASILCSFSELTNTTGLPGGSVPCAHCQEVADCLEPLLL